MDGKSVITITARKKMAMARKGDIILPIVAGIALGDGGNSGGTVIAPSAEDTSLKHELVRKPYSTVSRLSDTGYRYRIDLGKKELEGKTISEAALYDADGDLLAIRTFLGKPKDGDMEMGFEFDDLF